MSWLNPYKKSFSVRTRLTNDDFLRFVRDGVYNRITPSRAYNLYDINPILSDAVDMISCKFSGLMPVIRNKDREIITEGQSLEFLRSPNKLQDYNEFATGLSTNFLLNNNAFLELIGFVNSKPTEMFNVRNSEVAITEGNNNAIYVITTSNFFEFLSGNFTLTSETGRIFDKTNLKELYHIKGFSMTHQTLLAASKVSSLQKELEIIDKSSVRNVSILTKGFSAGGLLRVDTDDQDSYEQLVKDIKLRKSGAGNAGEILTSKGKDLDYKPFDMTNRDLEGLETKKDSKSTVYGRYDIPMPLIEGSCQTFNNYQTALYALYDNAVFPLADKLFSKLTMAFRNRKMLKDDEIITYDIAAIPTLQLRRFEEINNAKKSGSLSLNELRSLGGYESIGPQGDYIFQPGNLIPVGRDKFTDDNLNKPKKGFVSLMKKNGFTDPEIKEYWNEYIKNIKED